jgi:hypothetical protein
VDLRARTHLTTKQDFGGFNGQTFLFSDSLDRVGWAVPTRLNSAPAHLTDGLTFNLFCLLRNLDKNLDIEAKG